jgi:hypothetical protein
MKQLFCVLVVSLFCISHGFSQADLQSIYKIKQALDFFNYNKIHDSGLNPVLTEADIQGSPYLNDEFITGTVYTTSKEKYDGVPLRYNIYNDQLEFRVENAPIQAMAVPEMIEKVEMGNYHMEYIPYFDGKKVRQGFFIVEEKGEATLYSRPRVNFEHAKKPAAYQDAQPARFVSRPGECYIKVGEEPAKLMAKNKDLEEIFPNHKKELSSFIKSNKVRTNRPETMKELVSFYNSL